MKPLIPFLSLLLVPVLASAQFAGVDDFDDNAVDPLRWTPLDPFGGGALVEADQNLQFDSSDSGSGLQGQYFAWTDANYDEDFEVVFRAANTTMPSAAGEFGGIGIEIYPAGSLTTRLNVRLGSYFVTSFGPLRNVLANFFNENTSVPAFPVQPLTIFPKAAAIRVAFDSVNKVFTVYYDANPTDGVQWTQLSTFGVSAAANGDHNLDFGMSGGNQFDVFVYARTDNLDADFGDLLLDDFQAIQGNLVAPTATLAAAVAVNFSTQLGKSYSILRSTDLNADPAFVAVNLVAGNGTYRIVTAPELGQSTVTGTGNSIQILDPQITTDEKAFYKIVVQ